ncbi:MAG: GrpB family protein [Lentisphaerota bacterium]
MKIEKRIIEVVNYEDKWPAEFRKEAEMLLNLLSKEIVHVHHIGSTAVPGLRAKPVIDILVEVNNIDALDQYNSKMEQAGYIPKGEFGIAGRRFYLKGLYNRTHHVHAFNAGSTEVDRHIAFRDYLIVHPVAAKEYAELKARCAAECNNDNERYCAAKHEFVTAHEKKALEWVKSGRQRQS